MLVKRECAEINLGAKPAPSWTGLGQNIIHISWAEKGKGKHPALTYRGMTIPHFWPWLCVHLPVTKAIWIFWFAETTFCIPFIPGRACKGLQDIFTNCSRFPYIWNNPSYISCIEFRILLSFTDAHVSCNGSPQLRFCSTALARVTVECPAHNVLTRCQHGRRGCKVTVNNGKTLCCSELVILWQLHFTRADMNLQWHQLRTKTNVDSK